MRLIKNFSKFNILESSIETVDGFVIDEDDVYDIFSEYIEDVPQLKNAEIEFINGHNSSLREVGYLEEQIDFVICFKIYEDVEFKESEKLIPEPKKWFNRFFNSYVHKHDPLFKRDIINRIDERVYDQFKYHLIKMNKYSIETPWQPETHKRYAVDFCFGRNRKVNYVYFENIE